MSYTPTTDNRYQKEFNSTAIDERASSGMIFINDSCDGSSTDSQSILESKEENLSIRSYESNCTSENANEHMEEKHDIFLGAANQNTLYSCVAKCSSNNNQNEVTSVNITPEPTNQYHSLLNEKVERSLRKFESIDAKLRHYDQVEDYEPSDIKIQTFKEIMKIKGEDQNSLLLENSEYNSNHNEEGSIDTRNYLHVGKADRVLEEREIIDRNDPTINKYTIEIHENKNKNGISGIIEIEDQKSQNSNVDKIAIKYKTENIKFDFNQNNDLIQRKNDEIHVNESKSTDLHNLSSDTCDEIKLDDNITNNLIVKETPISINFMVYTDLPSKESVSVKTETHKESDLHQTLQKQQSAPEISTNYSEVITSQTLNSVDHNKFGYDIPTRPNSSNEKGNHIISLNLQQSEDLHEFKKKVDSVRYYWSTLTNSNDNPPSIHVHPNEEHKHDKELSSLHSQNNGVRIVDTVPKKKYSIIGNKEEFSAELNSVTQPGFAEKVSSLNSFSSENKDLNGEDAGIKDQEKSTHTTIIKSNEEDLHEFDHVRYKIITSNGIRNSVLDDYKKSQIDDLVQYLQDYSFQELLINNSVVIIEPVRTKIENTQKSNTKLNGSIKASLNTKKMFTKNTSNKNTEITNQKAKRHFYYHPIRINRELIDEELPDPDTVRNVRRLFENVLQMRSPQILSYSNKCDKQKDSASAYTIPISSSDWNWINLSRAVSNTELNRSYESDYTDNDKELETKICSNNTKHYVSKDILEKIRECGTSITYYGGKG